MQNVIINRIKNIGDWNKVTKGDNFFNVEQESGLEVQVVQGLDPKKTGYLKGIFKAEDDSWKIQLVNKNNEIITIQINFAGKVDTLHISGSYTEAPFLGPGKTVVVGGLKKINLGFVIKEITKVKAIE